MLFRLLPIPFVLLLLLSCGGKKHQESNASAAAPAPEAPLKLSPPRKAPAPARFTIRDIDHRESTIEFAADRILFRKIRQPIVMVTIFSDRCAPCRGMLPYLGDLQKKNADDLFLIGILVHSDLDEQELRAFMRRYEAPFFISRHPDNEALARKFVEEIGLDPTGYALPLTLLYKDGKYIMHITGAAPYEMLQSLVDQLKEKGTKE
ncbi:TlpA family protein disulfide reductase [Nitratifractor sp.]